MRNISASDTISDLILETPESTHDLGDSLSTKTMARGDLQVTPWANRRQFRHPTDYGAFVGSLDLQECDYRLANSNWRVHGLSNPSGMSGSWGVQPITYGFRGMFPNYRPSIRYNHKAKALNECIEKVARSDIDLGVALAEGKSTYALVASKSLAVLKAWKAIKKGKLVEALSALGIPQSKRGRVRKHEAPAAQWLELQFGWAPLLADIYGAIDAMQRDWNLDAPILSAVRRVWDGYPLPGESDDHVTASGESKGLVEVKLFYRIDDPTLYVLNSLGLINPLSIGWEIVPFSFVLDWFIPVGTFLRNLSGFVGTDYLGGYSLSLRRTDAHVTYTRFNGTSYPYESGTKESFKINNKCWWRTPLYTTPRPSIYVDVGFSTKKAVTALALLQLLTKKR